MDKPRQYSRRNAMQLLRKISLSGSLLLALLLTTTMWVGVTAAAASPAKGNTFPTVREVSASRSSNSNADLVHRLVRAGRLAPTVHVLNSLPPTTIVQNIAFVAFAMDARNPGTSQDGQEGTTSGINLEHMGMWFSQLQNAQKVLNDDTLKGTIFDGGNPPLHAGPQAMTDGQTAPVF